MYSYGVLNKNRQDGLSLNVLPHGKSVASQLPAALQHQEPPLDALPSKICHVKFLLLLQKITFQRLTAFSFAILAISGQTIAFNLARAAGSAKTIGPNALLGIQVRYCILSSHHDFLHCELKPVNGAIFSHNCWSPLLHNSLISHCARCICCMS